MNENKLKPIFFVVAVSFLFFAGVAAILYPVASNLLSLSTSRTVISVDTVQALPDNEKSRLWDLAHKYNYDIAHSNYSDGLERSICSDDGVVCYVDVPDVGIYLPCYYGPTDENLAKGAALLENTSLPVGGSSTHSVISGHTGLPSAEMFTNLDQIKEGTVFYIHVLDGVLAYKVDLISVVTPEKVELLRVFEGKDYCTLLTCTPYGINDKRLLVRGVRIPYDAPSSDSSISAPLRNDDTTDAELKKEIYNQLVIIIIIAAAAVLLYIAAVIWLIASLRVRKKAAHMRQ